MLAIIAFQCQPKLSLQLLHKTWKIDIFKYLMMHSIFTSMPYTDFKAKIIGIR